MCAKVLVFCLIQCFVMVFSESDPQLIQYAPKVQENMTHVGVEIHNISYAPATATLVPSNNSTPVTLLPGINQTAALDTKPSMPVTSTISLPNTTIAVPTKVPITVNSTNATTPAVIPTNVTSPVNPTNVTTPVVNTTNTTTPVSPTNATIPVQPTNTTVAPVTPSTPTTTATVIMPTSTTPKASDVTPTPRQREFDGPSFIGGIVLTVGLTAIGFVAFKFYKADKAAKSEDYRKL